VISVNEYFPFLVALRCYCSNSPLIFKLCWLFASRLGYRVQNFSFPLRFFGNCLSMYTVVRQARPIRHASFVALEFIPDWKLSRFAENIEIMGYLSFH